MNQITTNELDIYKSKLATLFTDIRKWVSDFGLEILQEEIRIEEEAIGEYFVDKLIIKLDNKPIAEIVPVGAWILGANGRVDIIGNVDRIILVDLNEGGPKATITISDGSTKQLNSKPFYKGIDEAGWYWIDRSTSRGHRVKKDEFIQLLSEASGHDFE